MSCQRAGYQWTEVVTTDLPHLSKPPRAGGGLMESREGAGPVVGAERRQSLLGPGAGAQGEDGTATVARVLLGS